MKLPNFNYKILLRARIYIYVYNIFNKKHQKFLLFVFFCLFLHKFMANKEFFMNKKVFLLMALASLSLSTMAQDDDMEIAPAEKHRVATNGFWQNWFLSGNVTWSAFYGVGERSFVAPFHKFPGGSYYTGLGASLALGKWLTPVLVCELKSMPGR